MKESILLFLIVTSLLMVACVAPVQQAPVSQPAAPPPMTEAPASATAVPSPETEPAAVDPTPVEAGVISLDALRNATYGGIYDDPITLTNGLYEGEPEGADDPAHPTVEIIDGAELTGDLDGDGADDAVVFLLERGGGSGAFTYVAAQLNRAGQPVDAGAVRIEDRIGVRAAAIEAGQVVLDLILQGPGDVACCGTHKARKTYALQEGQLSFSTS